MARRNKTRRPLIPAALVAELAIQRLVTDGYRSRLLKQLAPEELHAIGLRLLDMTVNQQEVMNEFNAAGLTLKHSPFNRFAQRFRGEANSVLWDLTRGVGAGLARRVMA